jgi:hypothetical protein
MREGVDVIGNFHLEMGFIVFGNRRLEKGSALTGASKHYS